MQHGSIQADLVLMHAIWRSAAAHCAACSTPCLPVQDGDALHCSTTLPGLELIADSLRAAVCMYIGKTFDLSVTAAVWAGIVICAHQPSHACTLAGSEQMMLPARQVSWPLP